MKLLPKKTYSAYELAAMKLPRFPHTAKGWYQLVAREKWTPIEVIASGRGRKGGIRIEYFPTPEVIELIEQLESQQDKPSPINAELPNRSLKHPEIAYKSSGDTIYIEHYVDVRAAAGGGQVTPTDQTILNVAVNAADWRNYVGLNHKHVKIITIYGDSMRPTFAHGDQVLVDTACLAFIDDGVYAIQQGDLLRVKRIKLRLDGSIEVKSDNTQGFANDIYKAEEAADFKIYGRVLPFKFGKIDL